MSINYKILEIDESNRTMIVRYWTETISQEELRSSEESKEDGTPVRCRSDISINIPIPEPTAEELHKILMRNAPDIGLQTLEKMKTNDPETTLVVIPDLINQTFTKTYEEITDTRKPVPSPLPSIATPTAEELAELIRKINPK